MVNARPEPSPLSGDDTAPPAPRPGGIAARALAARPAPYLDQLNDSQREAVEALEGPVLVLAGAGTGKTRVLTTRLAHLLNTGLARPGDILAVTFTNKAAREMKERIGALVGETVEGMAWLGTFHSIGARIIRRHAELVGLKPDYTILDTDDQIRLIKQILSAENLDEKRWPARQLAGLIDHWKNRGLAPGDLKADDGFAFAGGRGKEFYAAYQARLKVLNAADFGDLILESLRLFRENADVLARYQDRFRYLLVDEYQDTNVAQYLWMRLLAQGHGRGRGNICCVGDDDQSIYGWRGAEVDNILRFEQDFPGAKVIRLERNYRSTQNILTAASGLIANNESRLGKTLHTSSEDGDPVRVRGLWDAEEEARMISDEIEALHSGGHRLNEIAILVRASFQMREFEDRFVMTGVPYRVVGGPRFYERQEIRDAVAYLQVAANPDNDVKFERIVNTPRRGIGDTTVALLLNTARANGVPMFRAAEDLVETDEIRGKARTSLKGLIGDFRRWRSLIDVRSHTELAEMILDESGYTEMWQQDRSPAAAGRLENLKELVGQMEEFDTLAGFLEHVSLVMDTSEGPAADKVSLMTLHSAKGLEFDTVFLPGWEEGLFPHQRSLDENGRAGLEEERRLAYVGITRARRRVWISFASTRRVHGLWQSAIPSRFVDELPAGTVQVDEAEGGYGNAAASRFASQTGRFASTYDTPGWRRAQANRDAFTPTPTRAGPRRSPLIEGELIASSAGPASPYGVGARVFHLKFGYGTIASVDGNKLTVDFEKAGRKRVLDSFVEQH
jgi:DNA helicase-2/ATP-dependent DNA helicase PcrA